MLITLAFSDDDWAISAAFNMIALVETWPGEDDGPLAGEDLDILTGKQ